MQEPHSQVPSVARHGLSYWLWYHSILVGQRKCISSEHLSGGFLSRTWAVYLMVLVQLMLIWWKLYTFCMCVNWHPRLSIDTNYTCIKEETNYDNGFATSKSEPGYVYPSSHSVVNIMKAANKQRLLPLDLCLFGLDMKGGILALAISHAPAGPDTPTDVITCGCVAQGKACST